MNPGIQLFLLQQEISPFQSQDMTDKIHVRKMKLPQLQWPAKQAQAEP